MKKSKLHLLIVLINCAIFYMPVTAKAAVNLSLLQITDISGLGFNSVSGLAFDNSDGRLWVASGSQTNSVSEINPLTGAIFSSFSASIVPGLAIGPDGLALDPISGNLYLISIFNETEAGVVSQGGVLINDLGSPAGLDHAGLAFNSTGQLFGQDEDSGAIVEFQLSNLSMLSSVALLGSPRISATDFDPISGNIFAYAPNDENLLEIDPATGTILDTIDLSAFFVTGVSFPSGMAFNSDGSRLYFSAGTDLEADNLYVFAITEPPPDPLGGRINPVAGLPDWFLSPWFGFYNTIFAPWIFHEHHGFNFLAPESTAASVFLFDPVIDAWYFTSPAVYPNLFLFDGQGWVFFFNETANPRTFARFSDGEFLFYDRSE